MRTMSDRCAYGFECFCFSFRFLKKKNLTTTQHYFNNKKKALMMPKPIVNLVYFNVVENKLNFFFFFEFSQSLFFKTNFDATKPK